MSLFDPMKPRRHDSCPNLKFVPKRKSAGYLYQQKPMKITRDEVREAMENRMIYASAAKIAAAAIKRGLLKMPTKMEDL
jgi:hypothetical protein